MFRPMAAVIAGTVAVAATCTWGQNPDVLEQWYGSGVHAYFAGHTARAEQALTHAIEGGTADPRAYYFRALTYLKMGQTGPAEFDMATGAALEVRDSDGRYPVSRSLERIQGRPRQVLERYRRQARSNAYQQQRLRQETRYETLRRREQEVLRQPAVVPLEQLAPAAVEGPPPVRQDTVDQPPPPATAAPAATKQDTSAKPAVPAELPPAEPPAIEPSATTPPAPAAASPPAGDTQPAIRSVPAGEKVRAQQLGKILTRVLGRSLPSEGPAAEAVRDPFGAAPPAPQRQQADPFADIDQPAPPAEKPPAPVPVPAPAPEAKQDKRPDPPPAKEPAAADPFADVKDPFGEKDSDTGRQPDAAAGDAPAVKQKDPFAGDDR